MTTDELILEGLAMTLGALRTITLNLIVPLVAIGIAAATLHREERLPALPMPAPVVGAPKISLSELTVKELRQRARAAGHKALARNGRKAQLLEVLA